MSSIAYFNGEFIQEENACLHLSDLAIQRGYGLFDFFRVLQGVPVFMEEHLDRFFQSAKGLRLVINLSKDELRSIIYELIQRNNIDVSAIRLTLTGGYAADTYELPSSPNFIITQHALKPRATAMVEQGMKVITHEYVRELPVIKSIHYLMGVLLQEKVNAAGAADVLYHLRGDVSEFVRSNFFIVTKDDVIVTPSKNILFGITRMKTLELARKNFRVEERNVTLNEIGEAKEAFMTSTTKQIIAVVQVDDMVIGNGKPGEITKFLDKQLQDLIKSLTTAKIAGA